MPIDFNRYFATASPRGGTMNRPDTPRAGASTSPIAGYGFGAEAGASVVRRAEPRAVVNSALQALKALGPRLTPAQRTSIGILEDYDFWRTQARTNHDISSEIDPDFNARDLNMHLALARRPSFILLKPVLDELGTAAPACPTEMALARTRGERATITAQVAVAYEQAQAVKARAIEEAWVGNRICPLTLEPENFAHFLESNRDLLTNVIANCAAPPRIDLLEHDLAELASQYLAERGMLPSGMAAEDITEDIADAINGDPVSVRIVPGNHKPQHVVFGDEDSGVCFIALPESSIMDVEYDPADMFFSKAGLTEDFACCELQEQAASVFLQHLFFALAQIEQAAVLSKATDDQTLPDNIPAMKSLIEHHYEGSELLGDECGDDTDVTQRSDCLANLSRIRRFANIHDSNNAEPLIANSVLNYWIKGVEFSNDALALSNPQDRMERAQLSVVSDALRATGVFKTLPENR